MERTRTLPGKKAPRRSCMWDQSHRGLHDAGRCVDRRRGIGGISFKGHIPEGDGPIMGLLLVEMIASWKKPLGELVDELVAEVGPAFYMRVDLRLSCPVAKQEMTEFLTKQAPQEIGGEKVDEISQRDGVKYIMADDLVVIDLSIRNRAGVACVCRRTNH